MSREPALQQAQHGAFDLCIIGAGATGAGCALDAQLRGLRTILIDADDFASHTSSASTKLVHGGVRYLEAAVKQLDAAQYRLVRDALRERIGMLRNAPHLAHPLEFLIPCRSVFERGYYGVGMAMYEKLAGSGSLLPSRIVSRSEAQRRIPMADRFAGAVSYADGQFDDARYTLALVQSFRRAGGLALNYLRAESFDTHNGKLTSLQARDSLTQQSLTIHARLFLNATGPFSDSIRRLASPGLPPAPRMRPSKGSHVLFPLGSWTRDALLVPKTEDGRVIFAIPWNGRLLVGTTDDEATLDTPPLLTQSEVDYMLRQLNPYLKTPLRAQDAVSGFAGLRPLVAHGSGATSKLIRDDELELAPAGLLSIMGGKWTTYRKMAEKTIDRAAAILGSNATSRTANHLLAGADNYSPNLPQPLASRYGSDLHRIHQLIAADPLLDDPLVPSAPVLRAEVLYAAREEMALTLPDVLARRTGLELYSWQLASAAAEPTADILARELYWTPQQTADAVSQYRASIQLKQKTAGML